LEIGRPFAITNASVSARRGRLAEDLAARTMPDFAERRSLGV
jgi:hypothetical protein